MKNQYLLAGDDSPETFGVQFESKWKHLRHNNRNNTVKRFSKKMQGII